MFTLTIDRTQYDLRNGTKDQLQILYAQNRYKRVINNLFKLLTTRNMLEGGDIVIWKKNNKVIRKYKICNICNINAVKQNQDRCSTCTRKIFVAINQAPNNQASNKAIQYYKNDTDIDAKLNSASMPLVRWL